jgi:hypothetical protein
VPDTVGVEIHEALTGFRLDHLPHLIDCGRPIITKRCQYSGDRSLGCDNMAGSIRRPTKVRRAEPSRSLERIAHPTELLTDLLKFCVSDKLTVIRHRTTAKRRTLIIVRIVLLYRYDLLVGVRFLAR